MQLQSIRGTEAGKEHLEAKLRARWNLVLLAAIHPVLHQAVTVGTLERAHHSSPEDSAQYLSPYHLGMAMSDGPLP